MNIEVILSPAEFGPLSKRDLSQSTCVVFDVLRATSSILTALNNGAEAVVPVSEIPEALQVQSTWPQPLLAGERHGLRISRELTGSVDFDFGNSPREFTTEKVAGRTIIWTTTNGTRALRACAHAELVLVGAFLNMKALIAALDVLRPKHLCVVCAGTFEEVAFEDAFAAGALLDGLASLWKPSEINDAAHLAHGAFVNAGRTVQAIRTHARNARKLLSTPELEADVDVCLARDSIDINASLQNDGAIRPMRGFGALLA